MYVPLAEVFEMYVRRCSRSILRLTINKGAPGLMAAWKPK